MKRNKDLNEEHIKNKDPGCLMEHHLRNIQVSAVNVVKLGHACMLWQASVAKARETLEELQESIETLQGIQKRSSLDSVDSPFHFFREGFNRIQQERLGRDNMLLL